jgi:dual specificity tyrosine-phosphorylation-regulated kinase 2/3/4
VPKGPISPAQTRLRYSSILNSYEHDEIASFGEVYYLGIQAVKVRPVISLPDNSGFNLASRHYRANIGDYIAYRYEIQAMLGRGNFGQVLRCLDHKMKTPVAVKVLVNRPDAVAQGTAEIRILSELNNRDPTCRSRIVRLLAHFTFRNHICGVYELLGQNLYDFLSKRAFQPLPMGTLRPIAGQILRAIAFTHAHGFVHCDVKPENIVLETGSSSQVRLIDFGSGCAAGQRHFSYIQSRFYRAPEVIFRLKYGAPVDMWSFGCAIAELAAGRPLFPGESEADQVHSQIGVLGMPPLEMIKTAPQGGMFFKSDGTPRVRIEPTSLRKVSHITDSMLLDLVGRCLDWDPERRITATEALDHLFFIGEAQEEQKAAAVQVTPRQMAQRRPERAAMKQIHKIANITTDSTNTRSCSASHIFKKFDFHTVHRRHRADRFEDKR